MRPLHAFATQPHFVDHIAPVWLALDPDERGTFYAGTPGIARYLAQQHGINGAVVRRTMPRRDSTLIAGHQPHVLVASTGDAKLAPNRRLVLLEHGAGQTYPHGPARSARSHAYPGGTGRDRIDVFLVPSRRVADLNAAWYPDAHHAVVGCPRLDQHHGLPYPFTGGRPAITFHWNQPEAGVGPEGRTAWPHYRRWLEANADAFDAPLLGHSHPRSHRTMSRWWPDDCGVEWVDHLDDLFGQSSVLAADNTSALFEAAALGIPVVVLNAPWYRRDVHHGVRFWEFADVGPQVDDPEQLPEAFADALHPTYRIRRGQVTEALYGDTLDGLASARAVAALRTHLP